LNLNVVGTLSGVFSSKSNKETGAVGEVTEEKEERAAVKGRRSVPFMLLA
jgi:hypothetical protein